MSYNYHQKEKEEEIVNKNIDHHHHHLTNNNRLVISKSDGELNHHHHQHHQFYNDDSSTLMLNNNNNNNNEDDDDDDEIEVDSNIDVLKSNRVLLAAAAAAATSTANQEKQDHHNHHHHSATNNKNFLQTSQSSFSFPGDIHQHNHPYQDFNSTSSFNNLSDAFQSLFIPQFAQQIQTTIMSGLNWIHQIQATTLFQNFWTSGFLRRRFSQQNQSPTTTINNDSMVQSSSSSNVDNNSSSYNHHSQYKFAKILNGTIKLHTLKPSELIELSSFGLVELDQDVEPGIGHEFQRYENDRSTWCDSCGEFLFPSVMNDNNIDIGDLNGHDHKQQIENDPKPDNQLNNENDYQNSTKTSTITAAAATPASVQADHLIRTYFQCIKCKYVCHWKCLNLIRIDCRQQQLQQNYPTTKAPTTTTKMSNNTITPLVATALITSTLPLSTEFNTNNNNNNSSSSSSNSNSSNDVSSIKTEIDSNNNHNNDDDDQEEEHRNKEQQRLDDIEARSVSYENSQHNTLSELTTPFSSTVAATSTTTTMAISDEDDATINGSMDKVFNDEEENNNNQNNNNNNDENQIKKKQQQQEENNNNKSAQQSSYLITPRLILDLRAKILKYNERVRGKGSGLGITLIDETNGLFRGFLRVHMNLTRPINVIAGKRPPSIYDIINEDENNVQQQRRTLTSFYMPRDTVKNIHITSDSTSLQVIKAMLKKFKVVDNPQKFALYLRRRFPDEELTMVKTADGQQSTNNNNNDQNNSTTRISDDHQNEMTLSKFLRTAGHDHSLKRLHDHEKPLILQLEFDSFAYGSVDIVMQENDNADIAWDAFEIPELRNFLKILEREEGEHLEHVKIHYREMRKLLQALIDYEKNKITIANNKNRARQQPQHDNGNHDRSSSSIPVVIH